MAADPTLVTGVRVIARRSWAPGELPVEVAAEHGRLVLTIEGQRVVVDPASAAAEVRLGTIDLRTPALPGPVHLDFRHDALDGIAVESVAAAMRLATAPEVGAATAGAPWRQVYRQLAEHGFRDAVRLLHDGGAGLRLSGMAGFQRLGQRVGLIFAGYVFWMFELGILFFGASRIGPVYDDDGGLPPVVAALQTVLISACVLSAGIAWWSSAVCREGLRRSRTIVQFLDDMAWRLDARTTALFAVIWPRRSMLEPAGPGADTTFVVAPWRPRWRAVGLTVGFGLAALGFGLAGSPGLLAGGSASVVVGFAGVAVGVVVSGLAYLLPGAEPVELPLPEARRALRSRQVLYATFWVTLVAAILVGSISG